VIKSDNFHLIEASTKQRALTMLPFTSFWKFLEVPVYQASYLNKCPIWLHSPVRIQGDDDVRWCFSQWTPVTVAAKH